MGKVHQEDDRRHVEALHRHHGARRPLHHPQGRALDAQRHELDHLVRLLEKVLLEVVILGEQPSSRITMRFLRMVHGGVQLPLQLRQLLLHLAARADIRDLRLLDLQVVIDHDDGEVLEQGGEELRGQPLVLDVLQDVLHHDRILVVKHVETLLGIHLSDGLQSALVPVDEGDVGVDHLGAVHVGLGQLVESEDPNDGDRVRAVSTAIRPRPWTR